MFPPRAQGRKQFLLELCFRPLAQGRKQFLIEIYFRPEHRGGNRFSLNYVSAPSTVAVRRCPPRGRGGGGQICSEKVPSLPWVEGGGRFAVRRCQVRHKQFLTKLFVSTLQRSEGRKHFLTELCFRPLAQGRKHFLTELCFCPLAQGR